MLRYFNSGYFSRTLILVFIAAILWLPAFLFPAESLVPQNPAPLYQLFLFLTGSNIYLHLSIAFLLSIASALLLNQIATQFGFNEKISQLATLVYIVFSGAMVSYTAMSPVVVVNFLMLLILLSLFKVSEAKETIPLAFNASFILGIAALFSLPVMLFILLLWIALIIFRVNEWRSFVVSFIGLLLPFVFTFTWYFWNDQTPEAYSLLLASLVFHMPDVANYPIGDWGIAIILLFFILISVVKTSNSLMEKNINIRQILLVTIYHLAIAFAIILFFSGNSTDSLLLMIPASLLVASLFSEARNSKWFERALRLLLLLALINQYSQPFYAV